MTDEDKLLLVATVIVRQLSIKSWTSADGVQHAPCFRGDATAPVTRADQTVLAILKAKDRGLHDQIWADAAAILAALERADPPTRKPDNGDKAERRTIPGRNRR